MSSLSSRLSSSCRSKGGLLIVVSVILLAKIIGSTTPSSGAPHGEQSQGSEQVHVGLIWWPANLTSEGDQFSRTVGKCLSREIEDLAPNVRIIDYLSVRSMLYPLMESETQPETEEEFGRLLSSARVQGRLAENDLDFLLAFSGETHADDWSEGILCAQAAGCFGFSWSNKETRINAALWTIDGNQHPERSTMLEQGTSIMPAVLIPVPIPADTETDACKALSIQIVQQIGNALRTRPEVK